MMTLLKSATNGWLDYTQHGNMQHCCWQLSSIWGIACGKQSSKERWEAATVLFICGADHAGLHLSGDSGDPDEIPDRVLFLCMDLAAVPQTALIAWACTEFLYTCGEKKVSGMWRPRCSWREL